MLEGLIDKIKSIFKKEDEHILTAAEIKERKKLNAEYNDPEDSFLNDEYLTEEEMQAMSYKKTRKGNFRIGYYALGFVLALVMIGYGLVNIIIDKKYDIHILVQDDDEITKEECEYINEYLSKFVPDKNGDGEILIDVDYVYMPAEYSEDMAGAWSAGVNGIEKSLTSYQVSIIFGREGFLDEANGVRPLYEMKGEASVPLKELEGFEIKDGSTLEGYRVAVREKVKKNDKFSPEAIKIYEKMVNQ